MLLDNQYLVNRCEVGATIDFESYSIFPVKKSCRCCCFFLIACISINITKGIKKYKKCS